MKVLIIIDMQNDFITGTLANPEAQRIIPFIKEKIAEFREENAKILYTHDTHGLNYLETLEGKKLPIKHCIAGTEGWQIVKELRPAENEKTICKSAFGYNNWRLYLDNRDEIYLCGTCTDICVISNALAIKTACPESEVYVFKDGCAGLTKEKHEHALDVMASCQIEVI